MLTKNRYSFAVFFFLNFSSRKSRSVKVRGGLGADQHSLGDKHADPEGDRGRRRSHFCVPPPLRAGGRAGTGHLGARQHCRRLARLQKLCPRTGDLYVFSLPA